MRQPMCGIATVSPPGHLFTRQWLLFIVHFGSIPQILSLLLAAEWSESECLSRNVQSASNEAGERTTLSVQPVLVIMVSDHELEGVVRRLRAKVKRCPAGNITEPTAEFE
jgi:hypothetical protein